MAHEDECDSLRDILSGHVRWLRGYLDQLVHVAVTDIKGHVVNAYAAARIPDWAMRQQIDRLDAAIAGMALGTCMTLNHREFGSHIRFDTCHSWLADKAEARASAGADSQEPNRSLVGQESGAGLAKQ